MRVRWEPQAPLQSWAALGAGGWSCRPHVADHRWPAYRLPVGVGGPRHGSGEAPGRPVSPAHDDSQVLHVCRSDIGGMRVVDATCSVPPWQRPWKEVLGSRRLTLSATWLSSRTQGRTGGRAGQLGRFFLISIVTVEGALGLRRAARQHRLERPRSGERQKHVVSDSNEFVCRNVAILRCARQTGENPARKLSASLLESSAPDPDPLRRKVPASRSP